MTAAFYCLLLEPAWYPFQAINKTLPGALAAEFDHTLAKEPRVYPGLRVMPMGWQSACGLLHFFHRRLCFLPPSLGEAEFVHISELASAAEVPSGTAAVHAAWINWEIPREPGKEVFKEDEIKVLGARVAGTSGRISPHEQWLASSLLCRRGFVRKSLAPSYKRKSLEDAEFELSNSAESSSVFESFWQWIRPEKLRPRRLLRNRVNGRRRPSSFFVVACVCV